MAAEFTTAGIIGAGTMGRGIAQLAAQAGLGVRLLDANQGAAHEARQAIEHAWRGMVAKGRMTQRAADEALERLVLVSDEGALSGCDVVIEAVIEDLAVKQALFARLEKIVGEATVLATNTSSLSVTAIASVCRAPERVAGLHFFNPVPLMKVAEVVPGARTRADVAQRLMALVKRMGHAPVQAVDAPGFIVNHAGRGYGTEALRVLHEQVAPFEVIDRVLKEVAGFRMGPFELIDLVGLDISHRVMESVYEQFYHEPRFRPSYVLRQRLEAKLLGRKTNRGFYVYAEGKAEPIAEAALSAGARRSVWLEADEPEARAPLEALVRQAGWELDVGVRPKEQSLCLLAPLGRDATTMAAQLRVPAERVVAIDCFMPSTARRTLMTTPATAAPYVESAATLASHDGAKVSVIRDSPGFICARVLASIVNVSCELVQQGLATPSDLDTAVKLGLGYPHGPLEWGDLLGPSRILAVLEALYDATKDQRYRPSLWLSRRAKLGLSLTRVEW